MREIVLDIETTGLYQNNGDRIIEIACVELYNHNLTGNIFHRYINPEKKISDDAFRIHGISNDFLLKYGLFSDICEDFLNFIKNDTLIIHNARFDVGFINMELKRYQSKIPLIQLTRVIDTLILARKKFPGISVSIDSLCKILNIDNSNREKHGALIDAKILSEIYINLINEKQKSLSLIFNNKDKKQFTQIYEFKKRPPFLPKEDYKKHCIFLKKNPKFLWNKLIN